MGFTVYCCTQDDILITEVMRGRCKRKARREVNINEYYERGWDIEGDMKYSQRHEIAGTLL